MFHSARIKLTAWYLLLIMAVSISFSSVIYHMFSIEVERFARVQRFRVEHGINRDLGPFSDDLPLPPSAVRDEALITEERQRVLWFLIIINMGVLVLSGGLGYILAGRTLKPIADMVSEQYRFISDASHELRTPLTALKSCLEVNLRDPNLTIADAKSLMKDSITDVNKLQSLSDALLQLAQYEKPSIRTHFSTLQLLDVTTMAIRSVSSLAKQKHISFETHIQKTSIEGDEEGLAHLLVILLDNAIKYSPNKSSIRIEGKQNDGSVLFTVADHGQGISKKDIPHIFDRFYRADTARSKAKADGYGLGLSIAKKIVELHRGTISVTSVLHKGSTFTVKLPSKQQHVSP